MGLVQDFVRGFTDQQLGADWRDKRRAAAADLAVAEKRPELMDLQMDQAREALEGQRLSTQKAQEDLDQAQQEYEEIKRLFAEGKIGSSSLKTAEYLLKQKEYEARLATEGSQKSATDALAAERRAQTAKVRREMGLMESPEEAAKDRELRRKYLEAQTGAVGALETSRMRGREFADRAIPPAVAQMLRQEVEDELPQPRGGFLGMGAASDVEQATWRQQVEEEIVRRAKVLGYLGGSGDAGETGGVGDEDLEPLVSHDPSAHPKRVRDQNGQEYLELPNGRRIPIRGGDLPAEPSRPASGYREYF